MVEDRYREACAPRSHAREFHDTQQHGSTRALVHQVFTVYLRADPSTARGRDTPVRRPWSQRKNRTRRGLTSLLPSRPTPLAFSSRAIPKITLPKKGGEQARAQPPGAMNPRRPSIRHRKYFHSSSHYGLVAAPVPSPVGRGGVPSNNVLILCTLDDWVDT